MGLMCSENCVRSLLVGKFLKIFLVFFRCGVILLSKVVIFANFGSIALNLKGECKLWKP